MAGSLVRTGAKLAIGGGALYVTLSQGVWNSSTQGSSALTRFKTTVVPTTNDYLQRFPSSSEVKHQAIDSWNSGVQTIFRAIASTPETLSTYSRQAIDEVKKNLK